jgi:hypothetical protein
VIDLAVTYVGVFLVIRGWSLARGLFAGGVR